MTKIQLTHRKIGGGQSSDDPSRPKSGKRSSNDDYIDSQVTI